MSKTVNCWEYLNCGREPGGAKEKEMGVCPAAKEESANGLNRGINGGRICWSIAGTYCCGIVQGNMAKKELTCLDCGFFKKVKKEEKGNLSSIY
jgi:hypothetical protein